MNFFQTIFLDVVLLIFPMLVFLIYLSTNKNMNHKSKNIYLKLTIFTSFFMIYNYGVNEPKTIPILALNALVIFSYLEDFYVIANIFSLVIIFIFKNSFNNIWMLLIGDFLLLVIYVVKRKKIIGSYLYVQVSIIISSVIYYIWIFKYNYEYYNIYNLVLTIISYFFIVNIICLMYETGKNILQIHFTFKELQQEKQIRLSLFKITHEIKNPIAVCKGYLDMINVNDSNQVKRYIPIIKSEIERLLSLLQDFLLINKNNLELDIMDLNMLVEDTVEKMGGLLKENDIKVNLNIMDDEVFINGDYNRLSQVLINILKNSVEALSDTKDGEIKIYTKLRKNKYVLFIEDNGNGMTRETLEKMQEPFFTTKKRGSGLGVPLIYEIVEAHNGKIEYESEYGKGTKVKIEFPLYQ